MSKNQYLLNLTNYLIGKHRLHLYDVSNRCKSVDQVQKLLLTEDVANMSPEKMGEIMCSFEHGDIDAPYHDVVAQMPASNGTWIPGCPGKFLLQKLVSRCLAYVIVDRLKGCHANLAEFQLNRVPN